MTNTNRDFQKVQIMKSMVGLMQSLQKLSPHPDKPNHQGALFVGLPGWCHAPGQSDGMIGTMILEGGMGAAYGDMLSDMTDSLSETMDITSTLEAYETYRTEIEGRTQKIAAHGQGTLARLAEKPIKNSFNLHSTLSTAMNEFLADLPTRMKIENQLAFLFKQLKTLNAPMPYNAPGTRFAA